MWPTATLHTDDAADALLLASAGCVLLDLPTPWRITKAHRGALAKIAPIGGEA